MNNFFWISLGAVIGANLRYLLNSLSFRYLSATIPYATFIVNTSGSFLLGLLFAWVLEAGRIDSRWVPFLAVGFCGSYTTFSTFSYETYRFLEQTNYIMAGMNFLCNNLFSLLAVIAGTICARRIFF